MELNVLKPDDKLLRTVSKPIEPKELRTPQIQNTIEQLLDYVYGQNLKGSDHPRTKPITVGLSAPQVGINRRISVVDMAIGSNKFSDIHVLINPKVITHSQSTFTHREGCVNLPQIWGPIERYRRVTVTALDRSGTKFTIEARGWPAVLLQHEIDHLDGCLFIDYLSDPTKAHLIKAEHFKEYNNKTALNWPYLTDVSKLVKPL
jgi:peptide deformylase